MQLKFLEERKKAKANGDAAASSAAPAPETKDSVPNVQSSWRYLVGDGTLGTYTVFRHCQYGSIIELWQGADDFFGPLTTS